MLTRDQKEASLRAALAIAKEYAASGGGNQSVSVMVRNVYNTVNRIKEEIEQTEVQNPPLPSAESRRPDKPASPCSLIDSSSLSGGSSRVFVPSSRST